MKNGKVVVWISSATMGHEWATELAKALMENDRDSSLTVHVSPSDVFTKVDETTYRLRQADIMVAFAGTPKSIANKNYEMAVFPTSCSKYKTLITIDPLHGMIPSPMLESPDVTVRTCNDPVPLAQLVDLVSVEVGRIMDSARVKAVAPVPEVTSEPVVKEEPKPYNIGVAISLVKCSGFKCRRLSWSEGKYIQLEEPPTGSGMKPYICMVLSDGHKTPWMPTQSDLLAEDYVSL